MAVEQLTWVTCDAPGCRCAGPKVANGSREEARARAIDTGWQRRARPTRGMAPPTFLEHIDLCPDHGKPVKT